MVIHSPNMEGKMTIFKRERIQKTFLILKYCILPKQIYWNRTRIYNFLSSRNNSCKVILLKNELGGYNEAMYVLDIHKT